MNDTAKYSSNFSYQFDENIHEYRPLVAILLCTYNGSQFLAKQLDSLEIQTYQNWIVFASDDGSTDESLKILQKYQAKWPAGKLNIRTGPKKGFCRNFQYLISDNSILADFYAFCDQDDIWLPEKLARALRALKGIQPQLPAVYGSRTHLMDEDGALMGLSPSFPLAPSFENALVQSIAGGNTMVFNQAAKRVIQIDDPLYEIVSHDWWAYLVITGVGGIFIYDPMPNTYYRQHKANIVGGKKGFLKKFIRVRSLLTGNLKHWIESRNKALASIDHYLTPENQEIFKKFCYYRKAAVFKRVVGMKKIGIRRQQWFENLGFYIALFLNKI